MSANTAAVATPRRDLADTMRTALPGPRVPISTMPRCPVCTVILTGEQETREGICADCTQRPEGRRWLAGRPGTPRPSLSTPAATPSAPPARPTGFSAAEKSLIRKLHGLLPVAQLLTLLNERLHADLGPTAPPYTLSMLQAELQHVIDPTPARGWSGMRAQLAQARRGGVLASITTQTIEDFAIVYALTSAQLLALKDVIRHAQEDL